jgi:hypothetical protein
MRMPVEKHWELCISHIFLKEKQNLATLSKVDKTRVREKSFDLKTLQNLQNRRNLTEVKQW